MPNQADKPPTPPRQVRLPSVRNGMLLAAVMLGIGVLVGAAIGPAPDASFAGGQRVPALLAALTARERQQQAAAAAAATTAAVEPPAAEAATTPKKKAKAPAKATETPAAGEEKEAASSKEEKKSTKKKLPAVTNVWLIELAGTGFEAAEANATAAPYIDAELLPKATFLSGWSALQAAAFATDATLAEAPATGASPPLLHTLVQPPCPEGTAGASCADETPGQLTAADEFLKATLASITGTALYREHGLVVITFATVGLAAQSELPAGTSTSTLTYEPPAGAALLSPFAKAGLRSKASFNTTSPRQSLEALLH